MIALFKGFDLIRCKTKSRSTMYRDEIEPFSCCFVNNHTAVEKLCANFEVFEIKRLFLYTSLIALNFSLFSLDSHLAPADHSRC